MTFNVSWNNSWRNTALQGNWDAAWLFVKFRKNGGDWAHASLNYTGHTAPSGATYEVGLADTGAAFNIATNPAVGAFIFRDAVGSGTFTANGVSLSWNYSQDGVSGNDTVEIQVFAVEMVYHPSRSFFAGDNAGSVASFKQGSSDSDPWWIGSEDAITTSAAAGTGTGLGETEAEYYYVSGELSGESSSGEVFTLPAAFPKGAHSFYMMKGEISQGQWVTFFNTLTATQQAARDITGASGKNSDSLTSRNNVSWTGTGNATLPDQGSGATYEAVAMNYLSWSDVAAYLDWAGLRPMSELEYEKAGRGVQRAASGEYAWGSTSLTQATSISNGGLATERAQGGANCAYGSAASVQGPLRVGSFSYGVSTRIPSGAGYYGGMDLSGNVWERTVTVGNSAGRGFEGRYHGNGALTAPGAHNVSTWPGTDGSGAGFRGGGWYPSLAYIRLSDRIYAAQTGASPALDYGGRGVRTAVIPTWDGSTNMTWSEATDTTSWGSDIYQRGNDVQFTGSGAGTVTVNSGGVNPGNVFLSSGTYTFSDSILARRFVLSGGTLKWAVSSGLGTGPIYVTANSTIESTLTTAAATMANSGIYVSNGVALTIKQSNPNNVGANSPTIAPIHGGTIENPISLSIGSTTQRILRLSEGSDFTGTVYFDGRFIFSGYSDAQLGNRSNKIVLRGLYGAPGFEVDTSYRDIDVTGGGWLSGTLYGVVTTTSSIAINQTAYFRNHGDSLNPTGEGFQLNNGTFRTDVEFPIGYIHIVGNGNANPRLQFAHTGTYNNFSSTPLILNGGNTYPYTIQVDNSGAIVNMSSNFSTYPSGYTVISKSGSGELNLSGSNTLAGGSTGLGFQVDAGTLRLNSNMSNISTITANSAGTLGGTASITPTSGTTFNSGSSLAPGNSTVGTLTLGGTTTISGTFNYNWEFNATSQDLYAAGTLNLTGLTAGTINVSSLLVLPGDRTILSSDQIPLFTYSSLSGFDTADWTVNLTGSGLSGTPSVLDNGSGTIYLTGVSN